MQTAPAGTYNGALDVVKQTLARDGLKGWVLAFSSSSSAKFTSAPLFSMYRGMGPPLVGVTPIFALSFWVSFLESPGLLGSDSELVLSLSSPMT